MTDVTVPVAVRDAIGGAMFADITAAAVLSVDPAPEHPAGVVIRFDGTLTTAQVEAVVDRCAAENVNAETLRRRARQALQANRDFLAIANPTQAQVLEQVRSLTRQANAGIRFHLAEFDGTD